MNGNRKGPNDFDLLQQQTTQPPIVEKELKTENEELKAEVMALKAEIKILRTQKAAMKEAYEESLLLADKKIRSLQETIDRCRDSHGLPPDETEKGC